MGRVIEPRQKLAVGADAVRNAEGHTDTLKETFGLTWRSHRGPRARHVHEGSPGTWEAPPFPSEEPTGGDRREEQNPPAPGGVRPAGWNEKSVQRMVPLSEGNETRRDGRRGVGSSHSTEEAGESRPGRPCGGKEMS